jgi:hypothetical protein
MPPTLSRPTYHVWIAPADTDHDTLPESELVYRLVRVSAGDQLRAELEAKRLHLGSAKDSPMHLTVLWLWAALVRTGGFDGTFAAFRDRCVAFDPDKDEDNDEAAVTPTGASTS